MVTQDIRWEEREDEVEPLEGDEPEPEVGRAVDVGHQFLATRIQDIRAPAPPVTVPEDATVAKAIDLMRKKGLGAVMVVSLNPDPADEQSGLPAGSTVVNDLAEFMPALTASADKVYVTALMKCVPRTACDVRAPRPTEQDDCFPFLSRELTITTPHYVLPVGEDAARFVLGKLFKDLPYKKGDSLELRLFDNPAFKIVPVATPDELRGRDAKARKEYVERLRTLSQVMGL